MWEEQVCWWTIIFQIMEHYEDRWGPLLGLSEELVIKIVQCPDRSWYSHIKQQREAQFICTGVRVSQLDAIIPLQCATNEEEASYWLTDWLTDCDWGHSPFISDGGDGDCQNVGFLLNSDMADHSRELQCTYLPQKLVFAIYICTHIKYCFPVPLNT